MEVTWSVLRLVSSRTIVSRQTAALARIVGETEARLLSLTQRLANVDC